MPTLFLLSCCISVDFKGCKDHEGSYASSGSASDNHRPEAILVPVGPHVARFRYGRVVPLPGGNHHAAHGAGSPLRRSELHERPQRIGQDRRQRHLLLLQQRHSVRQRHQRSIFSLVTSSIVKCQVPLGGFRLRVGLQRSRHRLPDPGRTQFHLGFLRGRDRHGGPLRPLQPVSPTLTKSWRLLSTFFYFFGGRGSAGSSSTL